MVAPSSHSARSARMSENPGRTLSRTGLPRARIRGVPDVARAGADQAGPMTETPPQAPPAAAPPPPSEGWNTEHLKDYRRLRRSREDRKVAGVAGGLGRHLDVDPTILRVLFVVLVFFGGAGLVVYGAMWLLVPEDATERAAVRTSDSTRNALLISVLVVAALLAVGDSWWNYGFPWPLAVGALVFAAILMSRDRAAAPPAPPGPPGPPPAEAPPGSWTAPGYPTAPAPGYPAVEPY